MTHLTQEEREKLRTKTFDFAMSEDGAVMWDEYTFDFLLSQIDKILEEREKPKLHRCGACGAFDNDPSMYTKNEIDSVELVHCGCEESQIYNPTPREMYEAGIISKSEYENL